MLKKIAQTFDPPGLASPVIIQGKLYMQNTYVEVGNKIGTTCSNTKFYELYT